MDNQNNSNSPNNSIPDPLNQTPAQPPTQDLTPPTQFTQQAPADTVVPEPPSIPITPYEPVPPPLPPTIPPIPNPPQQNVISTEPSSTWPPQPQNPLPPPPAIEPAVTDTQSPPNLSQLDNPWNSPIQPPPLDGGNQPPASTWTPSPEIPADTQYSQTQPETQTIPLQIPSTENQPVQEVETAPTDLSHLISNSPPETSQPLVTQPETLVIPSANGNPEVPTIPTDTSGVGGIPKWIIGVGIGLLLVVASASAYFILGLGQTPKPSSVPATSTQQTKTPSPTIKPTPQVSPSPEATSSGRFGDLQGSSGTQPATSAADLLRQRQQQGR